MSVNLSTVNLYLAIRDTRDLNASQKSILYSLAARCKSGVSKCWPSIPTLAADAGMHERTTQRVLLQLVEKEWITIREQKSRHGLRNSSNEYTLHPSKAFAKLSKNKSNLEKTANGTVNGGALPPPDGNAPPADGIAPPEVSIEATKETANIKLSTEESARTLQINNITDTENLMLWFKSIGVTEAELQALKRDESTDRGITGQSITIDIANGHNNAGKDILIRPIRFIDQPVVMLDDLDAETVQAVSSRWRSAVVETSLGNHQVWIATSKPVSESQRKSIQRLLIATFGADPGSVSGDHWGRAPGFANRKQHRHGFVARLISASNRGKLLDVESVLNQARELPRTHMADSSSAISKQKAKKTGSASGDDSADEFGWCCGALRSGMSPRDVEALLTARASTRRGMDAERYAKRTVASAIETINQNQ